MRPDPAQKNSAPPSASRSRLGIRRFSAVELLIALALLFVVTPVIEGLPGGDLIETLLMTLVFLLAVLAIGGRRRMLLLTALLALPALLGKWMNHLHPHASAHALFLSGGIVFLTFVIVNILRFVLRTRRVNPEVLCASISAYLMLGLDWALAYKLLASMTPAAFHFTSTQVANQSMSGFTAVYFSFVTLSTLGYGDVTPVSNVARMLVVMESMTGTLYVAVLIARLVALYSLPDSSTEPGD